MSDINHLLADGLVKTRHMLSQKPNMVPPAIVMWQRNMHSMCTMSAHVVSMLIVKIWVYAHAFVHMHAQCIFAHAVKAEI